MTPAITFLKRKKVHHRVLKYDHDSHAPSYGLEAAEKLSLPVEAVFKTLVLADEAGNLVVALVPVNQKVSEKQLARVLGVKKVAMAKSEAVMAATGYVLGGVSPLGQKKRLKTAIDESAANCDTIYVSAGRRGLEVALAPNELITLTQATVAPLTATT